jgi:hypothetical protein
VAQDIGPRGMSTLSKTSRKAQDTKAAARGRRSGLGLVTALVVVAIVVALGALNIPIETAIKSLFTTRASNPTSENLLRGRWLRPDGGYSIEVRDAQAGGHLEAAYFNPRPINVARAEWHRHSDALHVFVELRDANYPGATYSLRYVPAVDQLVGNYFQPLSEQTIQVHFVREPEHPRRGAPQ